MADDVDKVKTFPFLHGTEQLKRELPQYLALGSSSMGRSLLESFAYCIQPSSAAAERAFSILNSSFGDRQESSLQDYIECSVLLQYNGRCVKDVEQQRYSIVIVIV